MPQVFRQRLDSFADLVKRLPDDFCAAVEEVADRVTDSFRSGGQVLAFGNGGSAVDASHFVAEFVGRFRRERRALPAISLSAESASVTALANDYGYERIFERQIEAFGRPGDVAVGLTTSGRSSNVLRALAAARGRGLFTVAFAGAAGLAEPVADRVVTVPSMVTFEIQEIHKLALHSICDIVEERFAP